MDAKTGPEAFSWMYEYFNQGAIATGILQCVLSSRYTPVSKGALFNTRQPSLHDVRATLSRSRYQIVTTNTTKYTLRSLRVLRGSLQYVLWTALALLTLSACYLHSGSRPASRLSLSETFGPGVLRYGGSDGNDAVVPRLIPRVIHQTYKSAGAVPDDLQPVRESWVTLNPGWQVRFWDDSACKEFVRKEFPNYLEAYMGLPKDVERADFFRYLVVLKLGGVYADIDTECKVPLDDVIRPTDSLVVGWEAEQPTLQEASRRHFSRIRQVQQWAFAGAPDHPALRAVCDHIADNYKRQFSPYTNMDTLERTGPGAWTDAVLRAALEHPLSKADDPWHVRVLPLVSTGVHPRSTSTPGLTKHTSGIVVLHHFYGGWKRRGGFRRFGLLDNLATVAKRTFRSLRAVLAPARAPPAAAPLYVQPPVVDVYPVSIPLDAPFTILVDLIGSGDIQSREDTGAMLTRFGNWQAGSDPLVGPTAVATVLRTLASAGPQAAFLDIGAGVGFFSLAAAAQGHPVVATELAPRSVHSLSRSIDFNGFGSRITLQNVTLGDRRGVACTQPIVSPGVWRPEDIARGYAAPGLHADVSAAVCTQSASRVVMGDLVNASTDVRVVRVSAGAWTAAVLRGGLPFLETRPPWMLFVEVDMAEMHRIGDDGFADVLQQLYALGYRERAHAGHVCTHRWESATRPLRQSGKMRLESTLLHQPTWCTFDAATIDFVLERNRMFGRDATSPHGVELLLLVHDTARSTPPGQAAIREHIGEVLSTAATGARDRSDVGLAAAAAV